MPFIEPRYADDQEAEEAALFEISWEISWHDKLLAYGLVVLLAALWLGYLLTEGDFEREGFAMMKWATSASILGDGKYATVLLHIFAHGGPMHLIMNAAALIALGPPLVARLGRFPSNWIRFLAFFLSSGLAGLVVFLAIHPNGTTPMLGASGAICGLLGLLARFQSGTEELVAIRSRKIWLTTRDFVKGNAVLFVILTVPALLAGRSGGVAWEAHLGGLLFGLFAGPLFVPKRTEEQSVVDLG